MAYYVKLYLATLTVFFAVDMLWLGLITYATYDLTNLATVKDWPLIITVIDLAWGMVLTSVVSMAGFFIGNWLKS
jgi:uncharacterized membrane protein